jgi:hypothetical protein
MVTLTVVYMASKFAEHFGLRVLKYRDSVETQHAPQFLVHHHYVNLEKILYKIIIINSYGVDKKFRKPHFSIENISADCQVFANILPNLSITRKRL